MDAYHSVALLLAVIGPALAAARWAGAPPSLALFALGVASTFVPGLPSTPIDANLVLTLLLPPLLYASTVRVSWHLLRFTLVPGIVMGILLVVTTVGIASIVVRYAFLPDLSWTAALLLGAVASIFDTRLFHEATDRPRVPRAISDTLKARELVGRVVILATVAALTESQGERAFAILEHYVLDIAGGVLAGLAVGYAVAELRRRIEVAGVEIAVSIATPYVAALAASGLGLSVVAAIITAALTVSAVRIAWRTGAPISSAETRVSAAAFWEEISLVVSSLLYLLAGRALPQALGAVGNVPVSRLAAATFGLLAVVLVVQFAFAYLATLVRPISGALRDGDRTGAARRAAAAGVMAWSSTRSVIGLVVALSVPPEHADRDLVLVVAALMIIVSVVVQGFTLRSVVRRAAIECDGEHDAEKAVAKSAVDAAYAAPPDECADCFDAARRALLRLRADNLIGDETLVEELREVDLAARLEEIDALPGSGPPNP
jgi:CPA1 family monovalent cation:H+ antiporter